MLKIFGTLTLGTFAFAAVAATTQIDYLDLGKDFDTPTCAVGDDKGTIFAVPHDTETVMKLNGELVEFQLGNSQKSLWDYNKKNQSIDTIYYSKTGTYWLRLTGKVLHSCAGEEICEYVDFKVNAMFGDGSGEPVEIKDLDGGCGV